MTSFKTLKFKKKWIDRCWGEFRWNIWFELSSVLNKCLYLQRSNSQCFGWSAYDIAYKSIWNDEAK